jgi:hypothetical protein
MVITNISVKPILTNIELPVIRLYLSFSVFIINLIWAFLIRLPFESSKAAITNKKIDHIPKSNFVSKRASIKKFKNPKTVLENLWRVDRIIGNIIFEVLPLSINSNFQ